MVFEVECIDRMYLNVYVPGLQYAAGLVAYVHQQLGLRFASTAPLAKITDRFTAAVHRFATQEQVAWVDFVRLRPDLHLPELPPQHLDRARARG